MIELALLLYGSVVTVGVWMIWRRYGFDVFHPVTLFVIYLFVQLGVSNVLYVLFGVKGEFSLPLPNYVPQYFEATCLGILATVLVIAGALSVGRTRLPIATILFPPISWLRLLMIASILFPLGYSALLILIGMHGGLTEFIAGRETWRAVGVIGQGMLVFPATTLLSIVALLMLARAYAEPRRISRRILAMLMLGLSVAPAMLLGFRSAILLPLVQGVLIVNYSGWPLSRWRIALLTLATILFFTGYGLYRELSVNTTPTTDAVLSLAMDRPELALAAMVRSRGADVVATVIDKLALTGEFDYGAESLMELATIWIPNALWDDKPIPSHMRFTTYFFGSTLAASRTDHDGYFGGISPTFVGETYWHLGYLGVVMCALLWGIVGQILYNTLKHHQQRYSFLVFYALFWSSFVMSAEIIQSYVNTFLLAAASGLVLLTLSASRARDTGPVRPVSSSG